LTEKGGASLPSNPGNAYSDDDTSPHHVRINQLAAAGLVDGKGAGRFGPKETVNRAQMAKFIVNAYEFVSDRSLTASRDYFGDDHGHVLERFINASAEAGFTAGRDGRWLPAGRCGAARPDGFLPGPDPRPAGRGGHHWRAPVAHPGSSPSCTAEAGTLTGAGLRDVPQIRRATSCGR